MLQLGQWIAPADIPDEFRVVVKSQSEDAPPTFLYTDGNQYYQLFPYWVDDNYYVYAIEDDTAADTPTNATTPLESPYTSPLDALTTDKTAAEILDATITLDDQLVKYGEFTAGDVTHAQYEPNIGSLSLGVREPRWRDQFTIAPTEAGAYHVLREDICDRPALCTGSYVFDDPHAAIDAVNDHIAAAVWEMQQRRDDKY